MFCSLAHIVTNHFKQLPLFVCAVVHVHVHGTASACVHAGAHVCVRVEVKDQSRVSSLRRRPHYFFETGSLTGTELVKEGSSSQASACLPFPSVETQSIGFHACHF